ncbi:MAG: head decoration protein [Desulfobulbus sp.]
MEPLTYANLLASDYPAVTDIKTVLTGQTLSKGTVLAEDSANSNKCVPVNSASGTASIKIPLYILAEDCDASAADAQALVYLSGAFNESACTFGGTDSADDHRAALRDLNIYLKKSISA